MPTSWLDRLPVMNEATARRLLLGYVVTGLLGGVLAAWAGRAGLASLLWTLATLPVVVTLAVGIARDLVAGRTGVDAVAFVSMTAALILGEALAATVVAVMYSGGMMLEALAVQRAERDLRLLIDRAPRTANRISGGSVSEVPIDDVSVGDRLVVRPGDVIPVDGVVGGESAVIDESALTGEAIPVSRGRGDGVRSGTINAGPAFEMAATARAAESTYAGILRLVSAAQTAKAPFMRIADRFALLLLPVALAVAALAWLLSGDPVRGLAVLVAATPCPLILAAPIAFISGISQAARRGILVKGSAAMEALAGAEALIFDKTGTLTIGGARLISIETAPGVSSEDLLSLAGSLALASHNIVSAAVAAAARQRGTRLDVPERVVETAGSGLDGHVNGRAVRIGSHDFVLGGLKGEPWAERAVRRAGWRSALAVFVAVDGRPCGALILADELRRDAPRAIRSLRAVGLKRMSMVTGDRSEAADAIGAALDLDGVLANRSPAEKVNAVKTERSRRRTIMVGDGINDAPALAAADVGIAMAARGASASSEAADVIILVDRLDRVAEAVEVAQRTRAIALQSIVVGLGLSGVAMLAAALGYLTPIAGALAQEAIDVAVILNALRALTPRQRGRASRLPEKTVEALAHDHHALNAALDQLRSISDALDEASPEAAKALVGEAQRIVATTVASHERNDERFVLPTLRPHLADGAGLSALSLAHREILHLSRLVDRVAADVARAPDDRLLVREAQRLIESLEALVRLHVAEEQDIIDHASGR